MMNLQPTLADGGTELTAEEAANDPRTQPDMGMDLTRFTKICNEIELQPAWRTQADRECDYFDGNQLDSEVLRRQQRIGMPPAIEPLIGPTIEAVLGLEAKARTDWRVKPDAEEAGDEVADALNYKLNQAERQSGADRACSEAYASQVKVGVGWVEVAREKDPFKFKYRCRHVHRNEIWWDFLSAHSDLSDARYLVRRRWVDVRQAKLLFPSASDLIEHCGGGWLGKDPGMLTTDGGATTDLGMALTRERGWTVEEQQWRDVHEQRVCLFEVWYRDWSRVIVIRSPDGRVVEFDENKQEHLYAITTGMAKVQDAIVSKMRLAWWMGPHRLHDGPTPHPHQNFPYVPFWGKREDRTGVPYGVIRGMMYLQDEVNARISKMQWGLASVRTIRTVGAVAGKDSQFREEIARPDADVKLNAEAMKEGGIFKVERDFELNAQQAQRLVDAREGIKRSGGIYDSFMGQAGDAKSGVQTSMLVEQSSQTLAHINDNFRWARMAVGDLLMSLIVEDIGTEQQEVKIKGGAMKEDRSVLLNVPQLDQDTGLRYMDNDVARTKLKVTLDDVPSSPSFRAQQLQAMSETFKSMPPEYQQLALPHLLMLMDVPNRDDIIKAVREMAQKESPEAAHLKMQDEVARIVAEAQVRKLNAETEQIKAKRVETGVDTAYSAMQAAQVVATVPGVAPIADGIMQVSGYTPPTPAGVDPNFPEPMSSVAPDQPMLAPPEADPANPEAAPDDGFGGGGAAPGDTSPQTPVSVPKPQSAGEGRMGGIETMRADGVSEQPEGFANGGLLDDDREQRRLETQLLQENEPDPLSGLTSGQREALSYAQQLQRPTLSPTPQRGMRYVPGKEGVLGEFGGTGNVRSEFKGAPGTLREFQGPNSLFDEFRGGYANGGMLPPEEEPVPPLDETPPPPEPEPPLPPEAEGGEIVGPGSGTSDSIPAVNASTGEPVALSDGEYHVPAEVVALIGADFFQALIDKYHQPVATEPDAEGPPQLAVDSGDLIIPADVVAALGGAAVLDELVQNVLAAAASGDAEPSNPDDQGVEQ